MILLNDPARARVRWKVVDGRIVPAGLEGTLREYPSHALLREPALLTVERAAWRAATRIAADLSRARYAPRHR